MISASKAMHEPGTTPTYVASGVQTLGTYRRVIRASVERIWENVLDWEHLPWLHHGSFESIVPLAAGAGGWRADVVLAGGSHAEIEVVLDRPRLRYLTRTLGGAGAGSEIETLLAPAGSDATSIEVDFRVPGVASGEKDAYFGFYHALYAQLWDEDESMMRQRQAYLDERLNPRAQSGEPSRVRRVVVDGVEVEFSASCPHLGGPLDDALVEDGCVTCPWHGYRFDVRTGRCLSGQAFTLKTACRGSAPSRESDAPQE
jgi:nitrite reductase/ring-hydroxylating ferredoxin subunit